MRTTTLAFTLLTGALLSGTAGAAPLADGASKFLGNITTDYAVRSDFGTYWNQITAENECKWASIEGQARGKFNFSGCKAAYDWAKNNGGQFKFHCLVWGGQYPTWLKGMSAADTKAAITEWFDAVQKQFPDLEMIDVVNEAIRTGPGQYHSPFTETNIIAALGGDNNDYAFVTTAFKMARERWPKAVLIYNDYNTFRWQINEGIDLVKKIKAAGAPVDAYGQQAHDLTDMNATEFKAALQKIHDGVQIPLYITEYDIGTDDDNLQKQRYSEQIPEFWNADFVAGVTLWGYIYGHTWTTNGNSGIIKNNVDRPAMTWLKDYMSKNKGVNNTGLSGSKVDTVPQAPYKGVMAIPGLVEAENYDVGGQNQSYYDADAANQGNGYRQDAVDIVALPNNTNAVGYTMTGEWMEYTVNVVSSGAYEFDATVSSGLDGSSFQLFLDGNAITDMVTVPQGADWDTYGSVLGKTTELPAGQHVLKIAITGSYVNIDKINLAKEGALGIARPKSILAQDFDVYSVQGTYLNTFHVSGVADLKTRMQGSNLNRGVYLIRGKDQSHFLMNVVR
ncbi:MAG TPA: endo-1,4-beta-xylanase [Fibrobacteria bacterium]|nr:endo-1,4-beta-xylanase [Fibrobacteria bacterium]